ncbi:uncharacterized protein LOC141981362 [Natator depressus]|uniref:uncharacterized protein LOC141981362 n=1 Tax=Natator depressus TaxID=27790 RepID=UPI003EBC2FBA
MDQLNEEFGAVAAHTESLQKAIRKRGDLLRKSEADLLQAREGIKAKVAEVEHLDSVVKKLKASIQDTQKEKNQKKREAIILRTEIQQLNQELQDVHKQYRETAPELASQDEKLLLMESSLKATQEQLSEQITETVHQEQSSRKSQTELQTLRERIIASEEGIRDYKEMLEKLPLQLTASKTAQQQKLHGALNIQQLEPVSAIEQIKSLKQQTNTNCTFIPQLTEGKNNGGGKSKICSRDV